MLDKAKQTLKDLNGACAVFETSRGVRYQVWWEDWGKFYAHVINSPESEFEVGDKWISRYARDIVNGTGTPPWWDEEEGDA